MFRKVKNCSRQEGIPVKSEETKQLQKTAAAIPSIFTVTVAEPLKFLKNIQFRILSGNTEVHDDYKF